MAAQPTHEHLDRRALLRSGLAGTSVLMVSAGSQIRAQEGRRTAGRAYVIARLQMRDPTWVAEYGPKNDALVRKHGGRFLIRADAMEALEGSSELPSLLVVLEFPSLEHARSWYHDPDYAALVKLRQTGSDAELILVEGIS